MFIGHFALGLAAKKAEPRVSLGLYFLAGQFLDLLWPTLLLLGVERVEIATDPAAPVPLNFVHYPVSHSLVMATVWGIVVGGLYWLARKDRRGAMIIGLLVLSHWVLDLLVHIPDLPLYPGGGPLLGFGLWRYKMLTFVLETGLYAGAVYVYTSITEPKNKVGNYSFWGLILFLYLLHLGNIFGPPPTDVAALAWGGHLQWLFVAWAFWVDGNREAVRGA